jgi:hypothetical protein
MRKKEMDEEKEMFLAFLCLVSFIKFHGIQNRRLVNSTKSGVLIAMKLGMYVKTYLIINHTGLIIINHTGLLYFF